MASSGFVAALGVVVFLCLSSGRYTGAIELEIIPDDYSEFTPEVKISCEPGDLKVVAQRVVLMTIHKDQQQICVIDQRSSEENKTVSGGEMEVNGRVDDDLDKTFLNLTLWKLTPNSSGKYVCRIYYIDLLGILKTAFSERNLTSNRVESKTIVAAIKSLEQRLESEKKHREMAVKSLEKRLESEKKNHEMDVTSLAQRLESENNNHKAAVTSLEERLESKMRNREMNVDSFESLILQKIASMEQRMQTHWNETSKMLENEDIKISTSFYARMKFKGKLKDGKNPICDFYNFTIKNENFNKSDCTYTVPVTGNYAMGAYISQIGDGALDVFVIINDGTWSRLARTHKTKTLSRGMTVVHYEKGTRVRLAVERASGYTAEVSAYAFYGFLIST